MYQITPRDIVTTKTIAKYRIDRIEISIFKSATIIVVLYDLTDSPVEVETLNMTTEDYSKWSSDDSYVIDFINNALGFTPVVVIPVETPVETPIETPIETPVETPVETPNV